MTIRKWLLLPIGYKVAVITLLLICEFTPDRAIQSKHFRRHLILETDEFFYLKLKKYIF